MEENIVKNEILERSLSSDGTDFFDFPLPPIPIQCVEVQNLDVNSSILYARIRDSYDIDNNSMDSLEELRSSYSLDDGNDSTIHCQNTQSSDQDDEDSSTSYRDKSPLLRRTQSSSPDNNSSKFYHNCYRG